MPYIKIWIHLIWATKNRQPLITEQIKLKLFDHIRENAKNKEIYLDFINGTSDHVHALISLKSNQTIADVSKLIKGESSHWVNKNNLTKLKFEWQDEYIAISVSESMVNRVREYIKNQEEHHRKRSFAEEYQEFLDKHGFVKD